jgi:hypothetical protein
MPVEVGRQFGDHRPDLRHELLVRQWWPTDPLGASIHAEKSMGA